LGFQETLAEITSKDTCFELQRATGRQTC